MMQWRAREGVGRRVQWGMRRGMRMDWIAEKRKRRMMMREVSRKRARSNLRRKESSAERRLRVQRRRPNGRERSESRQGGSDLLPEVGQKTFNVHALPYTASTLTRSSSCRLPLRPYFLEAAKAC